MCLGSNIAPVNLLSGNTLGAVSEDGVVSGSSEVEVGLADDLIMENWYTNIHTSQNPASGELRGQLFPCMSLLFLWAFFIFIFRFLISFFIFIFPFF